MPNRDLKMKQRGGWWMNAGWGAGLLSAYILIPGVVLILVALCNGDVRAALFYTGALSVFLVSGGAGGIVFRAAAPLRAWGMPGIYARWVLAVETALLIFGAAFGFAERLAPHRAPNAPAFPPVLLDPTVLVFWFGSGFVLGVFCARVAEHRIQEADSQRRPPL